MRVLSIDLAYRHYHDIGMALLEPSDPGIAVSFHQLTGRGRPTPEATAQGILDLAAKAGADILLLDGPQGWKAPDSPDPHSRVCERALNTPAKTGLPGAVKPANYAPFVAFSIAVFDELHALGWPRFGGPRFGGLGVPAHHTAVESFPLSAWRSLGLRILPAKQKATSDDVQHRLDALVDLFHLQIEETPNHDELQALVSGLAGIPLLQGDVHAIRIDGLAPFLLDGTIREGYIVNPRPPQP